MKKPVRFSTTRDKTSESNRILSEKEVEYPHNDYANVNQVIVYEPKKSPLSEEELYDYFFKEVKKSCR